MPKLTPTDNPYLTDEVSGLPLLFDGEFHETLDTHEHVYPGTGELRPTPYINSLGKVVVSSTPIALPAGMKQPETLEETVNRILTHSLLANYYLGEESLDEADDFDIEDDVPDPVSKYERDHSIAIAEAVDRGVVRQPTPEELQRSRDTIQRAKDYIKAKRTPKVAPEGGVPEGPKATAGAPPSSPPAT